MASAAMHMLAKQPLLRFGVGAGTAVVTERTLSAMAGTDQSMYTWIAGTTAGGAAWGFVGACLAPHESAASSRHSAHACRRCAQGLSWPWVALQVS